LTKNEQQAASVSGTAPPNDADARPATSITPSTSAGSSNNSNSSSNVHIQMMRLRKSQLHDGTPLLTPINEVLPKPKVTKDPEAACREKLRSRGIYLVEGNPCIDIDLIIKNLVTGTYRFNKPDSAYVDEAFRVVLALTTAQDQDVSKLFADTEGKVTSKEGKFAQHLEAKIRGGMDFKVDPPGPQEQTITSLGPAIWEWSVTTLNSGHKTLFIDFSANLILGTH
jgi:hypothetical protein